MSSPRALHHRRVDRAGRHRVHPDSVAGPFLGEIADEIVDARLGRCIGRPGKLAAAVEAVRRTEQHQRASRRGEQRMKRPRQQESRGEVGVDDAPPVVERCLGELRRRRRPRRHERHDRPARRSPADDRRAPPHRPRRSCPRPAGRAALEARPCAPVASGSTATTAAPAARKASTTAAPIPPAAPVTTATSSAVGRNETSSIFNPLARRGAPDPVAIWNPHDRSGLSL